MFVKIVDVIVWKHKNGRVKNEQRRVKKSIRGNEKKKHKILLNNMYKISVVLNGNFGGT